MKQASLLQRLGTYLLGLVDEYWAMRRPWQYGNKQPQCGLQCDGGHCQRSDQTGSIHKEGVATAGVRGRSPDRANFPISSTFVLTTA